MAKKGKRDFKFTVAELEHILLDVIDNIVPIGNPDWEKVWQEHLAVYPRMERTQKLLKRKFLEFVCKKKITGDPNCPPYVRDAKQILRKIIVATNGSADGLSMEVESIVVSCLVMYRTKVLMYRMMVLWRVRPRSDARHVREPDC